MKIKNHANKTKAGQKLIRAMRDLILQATSNSKCGKKEKKTTKAELTQKETK